MAVSNNVSQEEWDRIFQETDNGKLVEAVIQRNNDFEQDGA